MHLISDPPLSKEDIPSGLWLCHMCQMLQKQRTPNVSKSHSIDEEFTPNEMQKFKDSRPSTPITSDGILNAAKVRLSQTRSLSRVSSCSENSLSSDREIRAKVTRSNSETVNSNSNGAEIIESIEMPPTNADCKSSEEQNHFTDDVQCENAQLGDELELKRPIDEISDKSDEVEIIGEKEESQVENQPEIEIMGTNIESDQSYSDNSEQNGEPSPDGDEDAKNDVRSPFDELILAATILNPRQFELPRELNIYPQFPGDEKGKIHTFQAQVFH